MQPSRKGGGTQGCTGSARSPSPQEARKGCFVRPVLSRKLWERAFLEESEMQYFERMVLSWFLGGVTILTLMVALGPASAETPIPDAPAAAEFDNQRLELGPRRN